MDELVPWYQCTTMWYAIMLKKKDYEYSNTSEREIDNLICEVYKDWERRHEIVEHFCQG